jgi:3',5'-cyclic-AMP phosphodiesterase
MRIVQMSDLHVGEGLFGGELLRAAIEETNELSPDLVVVAGDLTMEGYRGEFEQCRRFLDELACPNVVVTMGNHDARNVGYRHFEAFFGARDSIVTLAVAEGRAKVVAIDSTKPDLDEGEVGREHYGWIDAELHGWTEGPRIVVIHHHILAVPGTGRDVNNLRDAGDFMAILRELEVDLVLSGHRHALRVEHLGGARRALGDGFDPAGPRHDAAVLQRDRAQRQRGPDRPARAREGRPGRGAAGPLRARGAHHQPLLPRTGTLRALRDASIPAAQRRGRSLSAGAGRDQHVDDLHDSSSGTSTTVRIQHRGEMKSREVV